MHTCQSAGPNRGRLVDLDRLKPQDDDLLVHTHREATRGLGLCRSAVSRLDVSERAVHRSGPGGTPRAVERRQLPSDARARIYWTLSTED